MTRAAQNPDLVKHAVSRFLCRSLRQVKAAVLLGADAVWIEECLSDQISPDQYTAINTPALRAITETAASYGLATIYYFCGNPFDRMELILDSGSDAIALEESKKGFEIDIENVVECVQGKCTLFGNLDAYNILEKGSDDYLRYEISRQIKAGRKNGSRFVMSLGSPITPGTPIERVSQYCDLVHELI